MCTDYQFDKNYFQYLFYFITFLFNFLVKVIMKKLYVFAAALAATVGFVSCNKTDAPSSSIEAERPVGAITVKINSVDETKAALSNMKDFQINSVQVFVFDASGRLETDKYVGSLSADTHTDVTVNTKTGDKTVYALVNHSRLNLTPGSTGEQLTNFEARLTDLSENSATNLVMSGRNVITVTDVNNNGTIGAPQTMNIFVKRLASRIQLDAVKVDFRDGSLAGATFTIQEIYLKNVVGKSPIGVQGNTAVAGSSVAPIILPDAQHTNYDNWYNKGVKEAGAPACIDDVYSQACTVEGVATPQNRVLFAFPNKTVGDSNAATFVQRHSRLVIKAHVTKSGITPSIDKDTYYVLDLPVLVANTIYEIQNVNITMLGKDSDDDDSDIDVGKFTPTITVDPWNPSITQLNYEF